MSFSNKLKAILFAEDMKLTEFSELTGISYNTLRKYKAGAFEPSLKQIHQISTHPRFAKYRNELLDLNDFSKELVDPKIREFEELMHQVRRGGLEEEAIAMLRGLAKIAEQREPDA